MKTKNKLLIMTGLSVLCVGMVFIESNATQELNVATTKTQYDQLTYILNNQEMYPKELIELGVSKEETIEFVYNYPYYKEVFAQETICIKEAYNTDNYPLFIQWDERWGYNTYGDNYMAINGCGPTTLAMVVVGLTGDTTINPQVIADFSYEKGYYVKKVGTSWELMTKGARAFGIKGQELTLTRRNIINTLKMGKPIIASMGPGTFTSKGHFVLLTGINEEGKIQVNDSDSKKRSQQVWEVDIFLNEAKNLWSFSL